MTQIIPSLQTINPPSLTALLDAYRRDFQKSVNAVKIGVIVDFDPGGEGRAATATVQIAQQQVTSISEDGTRTLADYPPLQLVPVIFPSGGGFVLTFPVSPGDECLLVFNDRELENWLISGAGQPPTLDRLHDIGDAICFVGMFSNPRAIQNISTNSTQLRSLDQSVYVDLKSDIATVFAPHVKVHAGISYSWDVNGYGQKITWTGGVNYTIDNYVTGAIVTTVNHPIDPPEAP